MNMVQIDAMTKQYKNGRGVFDISLSVKPGRVMGLLGPNGSGKTTIMKCMAGLIMPDRGSVCLSGCDPAKDPCRALDGAGFLIEHPGFYPYLSGRQNLELVSRLHGCSSAAAMEYTLEQVGLKSVMGEKVRNYSLGMKQRLGLAMAMAADPALLVLDEPCNGLDIEGMTQIRGILRRLAAQGKTIVLSSHLAGELEQVCTDVTIIRNGRIVSQARMPEVMAGFGSLEQYYLTVVRSAGLGGEEEAWIA